MFKRRKSPAPSNGNGHGHQPNEPLGTQPPTRRSDIDVLLNKPTIVTIGTAEAPLAIEIREPSNAELGEYLALMNQSITRLLKDNVPLIKAAVDGKDISKVPFDMASVADATTLLVAKIVGRDEDYVQNQMSARQSVAIIRAFLDVLGWEFIRSSFQQAMKAWSQAIPKNSESAEAPSWPVASSSTSPERSPN